MLTHIFTAPPRLDDLTPEQASLVRATRHWVTAQRIPGCCPLAAAASHLGGIEAARALHLLLASVGASWPEPIAIAPLCCARLTHDEMTMVGMVLAAQYHGRPAFDALLCEMLGQDARDRLFVAASEMGRVARF